MSDSRNSRKRLGSIVYGSDDPWYSSTETQRILGLRLEDIQALVDEKGIRTRWDETRDIHYFHAGDIVKLKHTPFSQVHEDESDSKEIQEVNIISQVKESCDDRLDNCRKQVSDLPTDKRGLLVQNMSILVDISSLPVENPEKFRQNISILSKIQSSHRKETKLNKQNIQIYPKIPQIKIDEDNKMRSEIVQMEILCKVDSNASGDVINSDDIVQADDSSQQIKIQNNQKQGDVFMQNMDNTDIVKVSETPTSDPNMPGISSGVDENAVWEYRPPPQQKIQSDYVSTESYNIPSGSLDETQERNINNRQNDSKNMEFGVKVLIVFLLLFVL
jgi:hypothetical protein